jgi:hypothetical protein
LFSFYCEHLFVNGPVRCNLETKLGLAPKRRAGVKPLPESAVIFGKHVEAKPFGAGDRVDRAVRPPV